MKKTGAIIAVVSTIIIVVIAAVFISLSGVKNGGHNYIKLEINPKIEFVTNSKDKVETVNAINNDAKVLIAEEDFIGLGIENACVKFVTLCAKAGYLDVDAHDNAIKLTVVSGITQCLEVKIYRAISGFMKEKEIYVNIVENADTLDTLKMARSLGVCVNKYELMESVNRLSGDSLKHLSKVNEKKLIETLIKEHKNKMENEMATEEDITNKTKLLDFNRVKYNAHENKITDDTKRTFAEKQKKFSKKNLQKYKIAFDKEYNNWYEKHLAG